MDLYKKFREAQPRAFFLDSDNLQSLTTYLLNQGWINKGIRIQSAEKAGEGNMNKVLRLTLSDESMIIIKQSRPWVEKFPDIPAPTNRADIEGLYFQHTNQNKIIASFSPQLLQADTESHILALEDLGKGSDLTYLYEEGQNITKETLASLMGYLSALHQNFKRRKCDFYIENRGMRQLNAEHIFRFPFISDNGLNLDEITPGLAKIGVHYRNNHALRKQIDFLKYRYLQNGDTLLQGDFYPGSFLQTSDGTKVIDPEFCFFGDAEFDLGVFYAHLLIARQPQEIIDHIHTFYKKPPHFSDMLFQQYAGIEIMRRILGLAQLPLSLDLSAKETLLKKAYAMMMEK